ncbi:hypothetical protein R4Z09_13530 [Niallia oryzisoli]|uniref:THUMP domain-containing protein n=1 Tax=Niallia oryzisoli TaxID=1737571 RepID=A0ABZ2CJE6_9BACI
MGKIYVKIGKQEFFHHVSEAAVSKPYDQNAYFIVKEIVKRSIKSQSILVDKTSVKEIRISVREEGFFLKTKNCNT